MHILDEYAVPHPKTALIDALTDSPERECRGMKPPFVVKPSSSSVYWRFPFENMKKVYFAYTLAEASRICRRIFESGYSERVLIQEFIGSSPSVGAESSVLTTFSDSNGTVLRAVLGDVLVEERGDTSFGNYSAIATRALDEVSYKIIRMLEGIKYTGIANFDILRSGERCYCLELNPRQGRSCDYLRCAGVNLAELLVGEMMGLPEEKRYTYTDGVWSAVPWSTVRACCRDKALLRRAELLRKRGDIISPYRHTSPESLKRRIYTMIHKRRAAEKIKCQGVLS